MIRPDLIARLQTAHKKALTAYGNYSAGASERKYNAWMRAEDRFDRAVNAVVEDAKKKRK